LYVATSDRDFVLILPVHFRGVILEVGSGMYPLPLLAAFDEYCSAGLPVNMQKEQIHESHQEYHLFSCI